MTPTHDETQFTRRREDGWPVCPRCGEDELYSHYIPEPGEIDAGPTPEVLAKHLALGVKCYRCGWESKEFGRTT